jgi:hypothetical protein
MQQIFFFFDRLQQLFNALLEFPESICFSIKIFVAAVAPSDIVRQVIHVLCKLYDCLSCLEYCRCNIRSDFES